MINSIIKRIDNIPTNLPTNQRISILKEIRLQVKEEITRLNLIREQIKK